VLFSIIEFYSGKTNDFSEVLIQLQLRFFELCCWTTSEAIFQFIKTKKW